MSSEEDVVGLLDLLENIFAYTFSHTARKIWVVEMFQEACWVIQKDLDDVLRVGGKMVEGKGLQAAWRDDLYQSCCLAKLVYVVSSLFIDSLRCHLWVILDFWWAKMQQFSSEFSKGKQIGCLPPELRSILLYFRILK